MPLLVKSPATIADGIHARTEGDHIGPVGGLEGPVAVAQKHVDGISEKGVGAGDRQVGQAVVSEIPGHQRQCLRGE